MSTILTVVGARPQFVKAAPMARAFAARADLRHVLVHTGQHYDPSLSDDFFRLLEIDPPDHQLNVGSGDHGAQTGRMMERIEEVVVAERPDCVLVYGDTNSTLAGALVAAKLRIPVAHVEAGLRSFDRSMPEEINRVVTDHVSDHLYCPSDVSRQNLAAEGITRGVHVVGDVMYDVLLREVDRIGPANPVAERLGCADGGYVLATIHRPGNTDEPGRLSAIVSAFDAIAATGLDVVWPVHPRTRSRIDGWAAGSRVHAIGPTSYPETLALLRGARCAVTDSGGLQKEAYWLATPCVTVRPSTEWTETVERGWNRLVEADVAQIVGAVDAAGPGDGGLDAYGDGNTAAAIVSLVAELAAAHR